MQFEGLDGFGRFGRLEVVDDVERYVCHVCGQGHRALGTHAWPAHGLPAAQYRASHGLPPGTSLVAPATRNRSARHARVSASA